MLSEEERTNLRLTRRYIELFNHPATSIEDVKAYLDESIVWREMPNRFAPATIQPSSPVGKRGASIYRNRPILYAV
jgi:hypothetical protein